MSGLADRNLGNYRVGALLGEGRVAESYRATDQAAGREVVLKVLRLELAADPAVVARFRQIAPTLSALDHPQIVPILDWGQVDGRPFLAQPLLAGGTLRAWLDARPPDDPGPPRLALERARQVAEGLAVAHNRGIVHGDLRPERIWLAAARAGGAEVAAARVADFGLAGIVADPSLAGAPAYTAPELLAGGAPSPAADLYALGVILYELLTGIQPFPTTSFSDAVFLHGQMPPRPPRELNPALPPAVEEIALRCLAKEPEARYPSAGALAAALRVAVAALDVALAAAPAGQAAQVAALAIRLGSPPTLALAPGQPTTARLTLINRGATDALVSVAAEGLPASWTLVPVTEATVPAGGEVPVELTVTVARDAQHPAGEYPVTLRARSRDATLPEATATTYWTVLPFAEGRLTLSPERGEGRTGGTFQVRVENGGNAPLRRALVASAPAALRCTITPGLVDLDPGASAGATLRVTTGRRPLGRARAHRFALEATSASAAPLRATGEFVQRPVVPLWAAPVAGTLLAVLVLALALALWADGGGVGNPAATVAAAVAPPEAPPTETPVASAAAAATTAPPRASSAPTVTAVAGAALTFSSPAIDFGSLPVGGNGVRNLQVRNAGTRQVALASVQITGPQAADFTRSGPCGNDPLDPDASCPIIVIFSPSGTGRRTARLVLTPRVGPVQSVELVGQGTGGAAGTPSVAAPNRPPPALAGARSEHAAALLGDGQRLLVAGGRSGANALKSVEIYSLLTNTWLGTRDMGTARAGHSATTLPDGRVVALGGRAGATTLKSGEIYDPGAQAWSAFPALNVARSGHSATLLTDARTRGYRIVVLGGRDAGGATLDSGEVFDSNTQTWTLLPRPLPVGRAGHTATLLQREPQEGPRLLVVGGVDQGGVGVPAQIFDPAGQGGWTDVPGEPVGLLGRTDLSATAVPGRDEIVFVGGLLGGATTPSIVVYDLAAPPESAWRAGNATLPAPRAAHTATLLPYGQILIVGGREGTRDLATTQLLPLANLASPASPLSATRGGGVPPGVARWPRWRREDA